MSEFPASQGRMGPVNFPESCVSVPDGTLLLLAPSANRVYGGQAGALVTAEIMVMARALGAQIAVEQVEVAGVPYLHIAGDVHDRVVGEASGAFALFDAAGGVLRPKRLERRELYPDDVVTIQKYQGKTNEQFTHLLMNVTVAASKHPQQLFDGSARLLDPMCGRGTTLNVALLRGFDITGAEIDKSDFEQYQSFITTWLRTHRLKHDISTSSLRRNGENFGRVLELETAPNKDAWKSGETQQVTYLSMDSTGLARVMRKASTDAIITDTPYGVHHGSHSEGLSRSPERLLASALPGWLQALRVGGAVGLAYNRHVIAPDDIAGLLEAHGLTVVHGADADTFGVGEDAFRHRVDASIDRDIVVALK